jgi:hypothetical protein
MPRRIRLRIDQFRDGDSGEEADLLFDALLVQANVGGDVLLLLA